MVRRVLVWFEVDACEAAAERVRALGAGVIEEKTNVNARHRELWLRDPDGSACRGCGNPLHEIVRPEERW